ncbi:hypothetical protein KIPB_005557, partial [Kipferlia bialata]|eukprot:g5557.t1
MPLQYVTPFQPAFGAVSAHIQSELPSLPLFDAFGPKGDVDKALQLMLTFHRTLIGFTSEAETEGVTYTGNVCIGLPCMPLGLPKDLRKALPKDVSKMIHKQCLTHPVTALSYTAFTTVVLLAAE